MRAFCFESELVKDVTMRIAVSTKTCARDHEKWTVIARMKMHCCQQRLQHWSRDCIPSEHGLRLGQAHEHWFHVQIDKTGSSAHNTGSGQAALSIFQSTSSPQSAQIMLPHLTWQLLASREVFNVTGNFKVFFEDEDTLSEQQS